MAGSGRLLGLAGRVLAVLLVLSACAEGASALSGANAPAAPGADRPALVAGPLVVDTDGVPLAAEHVEVVRSVYRALRAGDLDALRALYAGDDWAGQAELLAQAPVRRDVLDALRTHPANLGEGYLYPGFSADPATGYSGYQTAFFLDYDPPHTSAGPVRWRGIAPPAR